MIYYCLNPVVEDDSPLSNFINLCIFGKHAGDAVFYTTGWIRWVT